VVALTGFRSIGRNTQKIERSYGFTLALSAFGPDIAVA
jgi:hypothetical protein